METLTTPGSVRGRTPGIPRPNSYLSIRKSMRWEKSDWPNGTGIAQWKPEATMNSLWQDARYGARMLLKNPGFTLIAICTLALGIGANTAIFSVVNSVLLCALPYPHSERLITMQYRQATPDLADIEAESKSFEAIGGVTEMAVDYTGGAEPQQIHAALVTEGVSRALGVQTQMGRMFTKDEDRFYGEPTVVLTNSFWRNQLNSDPEVIGRNIPLSGISYRVIGVLRRDFELPLEQVDVWVLVRVVLPGSAQDRAVHQQRAYCLLKQEQSLEKAQTEMKLVDRRLEQIDPVQNKDRHTVLIPLQERVVGSTRPALLILFGAVSLLLLIACSNYANLLLTRATARRREMMIRKALGAGHRRLLKQMLTESMLLSLPAGILGLLLASWGLDILRHLALETLPRLDEIGIDYRVLLFTFSVSMMTGLLFGLLPAQATVGKNIVDTLKESGYSTTSNSGHHRLRTVLITGELAVSLLLLIGAGLLLKAFYNLESVDPGFKESGIVSMRIQLPERRYEEVQRQAQFRDTLLGTLNGNAEMKAALVSELPLTGDSLDHNFIIEGRPPLAPGTEPSLISRSIVGDYFRIMQIPLVQGRAFSAEDALNSPLVGIVNQATVRQYFPNRNAIGSRFRWADDETPHWITIVGVAADVKHFGLDQPDEPAVYTLYAQAPKWKRWMNLVVDSRIPPKETLDIIKGSVKKLDPQIPITKVRWMSELAAYSLERQRFNLYLLGIFAIVAVLLSAMGIYGVISHFVNQRTHEIGIRMALGARKNDILRLVVGQCLMLTITGILFGMGGALALTRLMAGLLFGVGARDPLTFATVAALLASVALCAGFFPARRASQVDPMHALRYE